MNWRTLPLALILAACTYSETPFGRYAEIDLPIQSQTTIHKTITVNAPAGHHRKHQRNPRLLRPAAACATANPNAPEGSLKGC